MISLTSNGVTLPLYDGLQWSDEFTWSPVAMSAEHSTDGALLIDVAMRQAGRPITLEMPQGAGWATTREQVVLLAAWASRVPTPSTPEFVLHLRGRDFAVVFDHTSGSGFEAELMRDLNDDSAQESEAEYRVRFRFMEV